MSYPRTALRSRKRLGDLMVDGGLLSNAQLEEVLASRIVVEGRPERVGETAVRLGFVTTDDIARTVAAQLELDYFSAPVLPIDPELVKAVSEHIAKRHKVVALWREGDEVAVACADPTNVIALDDVRVTVGARRVRPIVAPAHVVESALTKAYGSARTASDIARALSDVTGATADPADAAEVDEPLLDDAPVVRLTQEVLLGAVAARASDIHIEPTTNETVIRHRIDGVLHEALRVPRSIGAPMVSRLKLLASLDIAEKRRPQDGRAQFRGADGELVDLRLSTLPTMFGESVVMRLLHREEADRSLSSLGFDEAQEATLLAAVERPQGLVLVTGPTGSGKTSTLYALLAGLATTERKLITVEDPIEYELEGVQQTQVNERAGYTFARALRAILRQDPDVVMVGEIRDPETAELALEASLTGHLVLSTLHTNDAPSAVVRLRELGVPTYLLTSALSLVVAQRLVRRTCTACTDHFPISRRVRSRLHIPAGIDTSLAGRGCARCDYTGYQGRVGIYEILSVDAGVRELIADEAPGTAIQRAARAGSYRSLREDALVKAAEGITTLEEVVRVTPKDEGQESTCPVCHQGTEPDYAVCPWCAADLRPYSCSACDHALDPKWAACPRCGVATGDPDEAGSGHLPTVLVVDDDPSVRSAISAMLTGDYGVVEAADGVEALERIHRLRPAAIVLDKGLPDIDGYEVTREIRSRPTVRDTPVVIVTGHDDPDVELEGLRAGADDWIAKPFEPDLLLARLDRLIRRAAVA